jgi:hypothetical protein
MSVVIAAPMNRDLAATAELDLVHLLITRLEASDRNSAVRQQDEAALIDVLRWKCQRLAEHIADYAELVKNPQPFVPLLTNASDGLLAMLTACRAAVPAVGATQVRGIAAELRAARDGLTMALSHIDRLDSMIQDGLTSGRLD